MLWNQRAKRLLKSELVKRGISNAQLSILLRQYGIEETKSSIDSKISRGTFSAAFLLQSLTAIGCNEIDLDWFEPRLSIIAEPLLNYEKQIKGTNTEETQSQ